MFIICTIQTIHITLYFIIFHIHVLFAKHSVVQIFGRRNIIILNEFECISEFSGKNKLLKVLCYEKFDSISAI